MENLIHLCDSAHGVFIPQIMVPRLIEDGWKGISQEDSEIIEEGPEHELYWDVWNDILDNAYLIDGDDKWLLHQDGDLWAYSLSASEAGELNEFFGDPD